MAVDRASEQFIRQLFEDADPTPVSEEIAPPEEDIDRPVTQGNLFTHHDTHPIILDMALLRIFGTEWLEWEPETLREEIERRHNGLSELNWNQIQAVKTLHLHDSPWTDYEAFVPVLLALNNSIPIFTLLQRPTIAQLMAGVDIMDQVRDEEFNAEISHFVAACFLEEGVVYAPPPLEFAQEAISQPMYYCPDCGSHIEDLPVDGICDVCAERFVDGHPLNYRPNPDVMEKIRQTGEGTRYKTYLKRPFKEVQDRLADFEATEQPLQEDVVDIQAAKLIVARNYMEHRRQQLRDQLKTLRLWLGEEGAQ